MYTPSITAVCPELPKGPPDLFCLKHGFSKNIDVRKELAIPAGLEPATYALEVRCSIQLSYGTLKKDAYHIYMPEIGQ